MPKVLGDKPRNLSRNQEMMMEQDAKRVGGRSLPKKKGDKPRNPSRNQEIIIEQDAKKVGKQTPES